MNENTAFLTGTLSHIKIEDKGTWLKGSALLKGADVDLWIEIKSLAKGDRAIQTLPQLEGQRVLVRGRLSSYTMKAKPPQYPNDRTFYQFAVPKNSIQPISDGPDVNRCAFIGKVLEARQNEAGTWFAEMALPYRDVKNNTFREYLARVRFGDRVITKGDQLFVEGRVQVVNKAVLVDAQIVAQEV